MSDPAELNALRRFVSAALGDEWTVFVDESQAPPFVSVVLEHPLAGRVYQVMDERHGDLVEEMRRRFDAPEFRVIADRPASMPHMDLVGRLRTFSAGHELPLRALDSLAALLREERVITAEEAAWLSWAGLPWSRDEPAAATFAEFLAEGDEP